MGSTAAFWALLLITVAKDATAIMLPSRGKLSGTELTDAACKGVPGGLTVCHPYSDVKYIYCGANDSAGTSHKVMSCPKYTAYDYGLRTCIDRNLATKCPGWACPAPGTYESGTKGSSPFIGVFGSPGNTTVTIGADMRTRTYFCPTTAHCQHGMVFKVTSLGAAPANHPVQTHVVDWVELTTNTVVYPKRVDNIVGYEGDKIVIKWDEAVHLVAEFDPTAQDAAPVVPYLPQPVYKCPTWREIGGNQSVALYNLNPGEIRLLEAQLGGPGSYRLAVNSLYNNYYVTCQLGYHCRGGMIFKLTVMPLPPSSAPTYVPKVHNISWVLSDFQNFPDLAVYPTDILHFEFPGAKMTATGPDFSSIQPHGITLLPPALVTPYVIPESRT